MVGDSAPVGISHSLPANVGYQKFGVDSYHHLTFAGLQKWALCTPTSGSYSANTKYLYWLGDGSCPQNCITGVTLRLVRYGFPSSEEYSSGAGDSYGSYSTTYPQYDSPTTIPYPYQTSDNGYYLTYPINGGGYPPSQTSYGGDILSSTYPTYPYQTNGGGISSISDLGQLSPYTTSTYDTIIIQLILHTPLLLTATIIPRHIPLLLTDIIIPLRQKTAETTQCTAQVRIRTLQSIRLLFIRLHRMLPRLQPQFFPTQCIPQSSLVKP